MDRNFIVAMILAAVILIGWDVAVLGPQRRAIEAERAAQAEAAQAERPVVDDLTGLSAETAETAEESIGRTSAQRVAIETPTVVGSINLEGAIVDDLSLKDYRTALDPRSPMVRILAPRDIAHGQYVDHGAATFTVGVQLSTQALAWTAPAGARLTPQTPVTLTATSGPLRFEKTFSIDDRYMIEVRQTVTNAGDAPVRVQPYGFVIQRGIPENLVHLPVHEGPIFVADAQLAQRKYKNAVKAAVEAAGAAGWAGITSQYWLAAVAPPRAEGFTASMKNVGDLAAPIFRSGYLLAEREVAPGASVAFAGRAFSGPKEVQLLRSYQKPGGDAAAGVHAFDRAIDWGMLSFLTRPTLALLDFFADKIGNIGISILLLTLVVRSLMFPLANKSFESMSKMKKLQPQVEELKKRFPDDQMKLQQEMMALYKREKLNPLAGCVPVLLQIPVFFALYKSLSFAIELRHAPFFGWIKDLSAPDPTTVFNLFGLLPWDPTSAPLIGGFLAIGALPLAYGVAMWLQTKLNPPAPDPMQQQIMTMLPIVFVFIFAGFASGLVLYWLFSAVLSIAQQWVIMKRNGVEVDLIGNLGLRKKKPAAPAKT